MKLFFDQNLARDLVAKLQSLYPDSKHVRDVGLASASDDEVWNYARTHGLTIVSKDTDFYHRSMLLGHPPKVIWIRLGNGSTRQINEMLVARLAEIIVFEQDPDASFLVLS